MTRARSPGTLAAMDIAELNRRLANLIRHGTVTGVQHAPPRVRVKTGGNTTDWLRYWVPRAGTTRDWDPPVAGEQCILLCPSGELTTAFVLTGLYSDAFPPPSGNPELCVRVWPDGARLTYDHAAGALSATGIKTALVQAADKCTVDCPLTEFTGDVQIRGNLTVDGEALVKSLLSYLSGLSGQNGEGGQTVIEGDIQHRGTLSNTGRIESNGVGVDDHEHPGDSGGTTGKPNR